MKQLFSRRLWRSNSVGTSARRLAHHGLLLAGAALFGVAPGAMAQQPTAPGTASSRSFSAPPVISGFTPTSGPVGTVPITGTGFSAAAGQNAVFFGATQAPVTAASATSLTVTVPLGATYQFPSVTNLASALTTYAGQPFGVTLSGAVAFDLRGDVGTGANPYSVRTGDVDGDGKPDLAVTNDGSKLPHTSFSQL